MSPKAQQIAIAETCGWTQCKIKDGFVVGIQPGDDEHDGLRGLPDYLNSLDWMYEAEKILLAAPVLSKTKCNTYQEILFQQVFSPGHCCVWHATAAQRAEAFLKTIGKWK